MLVRGCWLLNDGVLDVVRDPASPGLDALVHLEVQSRVICHPQHRRQCPSHWCPYGSLMTLCIQWLGGVAEVGQDIKSRSCYRQR